MKADFVEKLIILKKIYENSDLIILLIWSKTDEIETLHQDDNVNPSPYKSYRQPSINF
jgi:hypothetical protein